MKKLYACEPSAKHFLKILQNTPKANPVFFFLMLCMLMVGAKTTSAQTSYELVTNVSQLNVGDKVIIVSKNGSNYFIMSGQKTSNRDARVLTGSEMSGTKITVSTDYVELTLGKNGSNWTFYDGVENGYLYASSGSANQLKTRAAESDGNSRWSISISSNIASVQATGGNSRKVMQGNYNLGAPLVACYASASQDDIYIYKIAAPALTPSPTSLSGFTYEVGSGPSTSQSFSLTGSNLTGAPDNITISGSTNYEVSSDNITFGASASVGYSSATLSATLVYVRLKSGLAIGNYNGETISISGSGASTSISASGSVTRKTYTSNGDGPWTTGGTWVGGVSPGTNDNVVINHNVTSGAVTRDAGTTTTVNAGKKLIMSGTYTNNGTSTINGTFQLDNGAWATGNGLVYGAGSGTLVFNTSSQYGVNNDAYWPATNGPVNVTAQNTGGIKLYVSRTVTGTVTINAPSEIASTYVLTSSGTLSLASTLDVKSAGGLVINGTFQINSGNLNTNSPVYGNSSTLIYNVNYGPYLEWTGNAAAAGTGVPQNVIIQSGKTVTMPNTNRGLAGNLTINGTLVLNNSAGDIYVGGNWERALGGTFTHNNRAVFFNGQTTQTVNAVSGQAATFAYLFVGAGAGTTILKFGGDVNVGTNSQTGTVLSLGGNTDVIDLNGKKLTVGTNGVTSTISGTGSFKGNITSDLELKGTGNIGATLKFTGDLNLRILTLYRTNASLNGGFTLGSDLIINNSIVFTSGVIYLGDNNITFNNSATVGGSPAALSMIVTNGNGQVKKVFDNSNMVFTYPIGNVVPTNNRIYTPATLDFTGTLTLGTPTIGILVKPVIQPYTDIATSKINRYWSVSQTGLSGTYTCAVSFTYNTTSPTDVVGTEGNIKIAGYSGADGGWTVGGITNPTTHILSATGITTLLDLYTGGDNFTLVTKDTDYFRSKQSGLWNDKNNWESSPDNGVTWYASTKFPNNSSSPSILIKDSIKLNLSRTLYGITVGGGGRLFLGTNLTINNGKALTIDNGGILYHPDTTSLTINTGATFTVNNGGIYVIYGKMPALTGNMIINSGGTVRADNNSGGESDDIAMSSSSKVSFETGAIFDWNISAAFQTSKITYFPSGNKVPIFRVSKFNGKVGASGGSNSLVINGILEVNSVLTIDTASSKTFRDGFMGSGIINIPNNNGTITVGGGLTQPILGGNGLTLNIDKQINLSSGIVVPTDANVTVNGTVSFAKGSSGIFKVDGVLDLTTFNITNTSGSVDVNGTLKTANTNGLFGTGANISSGTLNLNTGSTIEYNATASQAITTSLSYYSITFKGGTKTFSSSISTNVNGTVTISGPSVFLDASSNNLGPTAANTTNFNMDGGTLILGTAGSQPNMNGTYNITGGVIKFNGTTQTIRPKAYQNIEILDGAVVGSGSGYINLNTNGSFTVKSWGTFNNTNFSIKATDATSGQTVTVEANGKITTDRKGGFYGSDGTGSVYSVVHSNIPAGSISLSPTSTIEFLRNTGENQLTKTGGITYGNIILSGNGQKVFEGVVSVAGNITAGADMVLNSTTKGNLYLGGTTDQTISGVGNLYLHTLQINKNSGIVYLERNINQIDNNLTLTKGLLDVKSGVEINMSDGAGITGNGGNFNTTTTGKIVFKGNSVIGGSNQLDFYPAVYLTPSGAKGVDFGTKATIRNLLQLDAGSYVNPNAPSYASGSLLKYNNGGGFDRGLEWSAASGAGFPYNVQLSNSTIFNPARGDGSNQNIDFNIGGNLTIDNGSSIRMDYGVGPTYTGMQKPLVVGGNLNIDGELYASLLGGGDIMVNGNWTRGTTGKFYANNRAVFFLGSGNSTIKVNAVEKKEVFPYLILDKSAQGTLLSLNDSIEIEKKFTFTRGTLQLGNSDVTFQSRSSNTAALTQLDGSKSAIEYSGDGRFVIERYLGNHKSWQFLSAPTKGSTFNSAWQEGNSPLGNVGKGGYGTMLTGTATATGYDYTSPQPSLKTFNATTQKYEEVSNTANPMNSTSGYMVFVRGDRTIAPTSSGFSSTILRTRGKIYAPGAEAPTSITVPKDKFALIGNPYPSAINFSDLVTTNIPNSYYVWDPNSIGSHGTGWFQTISAGTITPGYTGFAGIPPIQSGQAFFVKATSAGDGTVSIPESAKYGESVGVVFLTGNTNKGFPPDASSYLRANLYRMVGTDAVLVDGVISLFHGEYNPLIDMWDAEKMTNPSSENMGIRSLGYVLAIERTTERENTDTIFYKMNNYKVSPYRFVFDGKNLDATGQDVFLFDKFLNTYTSINANGLSVYNFDVKGSPAGSWDENRFMVVFKPNGPIPVTLTNVKAYTQNKDVMVEWTAATESNMKSYTVETSLDGKTFSTGGTLAAKNIDGTVYHWLDVAPVAGYHYYRILSTGLDGKVSYSKIVSALVGGNAKSSISIYPNPIKDGVMNVQFENQDAGMYQLRVLNTVGQVMMTNTINHAGGNGSQQVKLPSTLVKGMYQVEVWKGSERVMSEKVVY